jgi:opacity protein-like surface antigen
MRKLLLAAGVAAVAVSATALSNPAAAQWGTQSSGGWNATPNYFGGGTNYHGYGNMQGWSGSSHPNYFGGGTNYQFTDPNGYGQNCTSRPNYFGGGYTTNCQ